MDDVETRIMDSFRDVARAILPSAVQRRQSAVNASFNDAGEINNDALARTLPPYVVTWWLPGVITTGNDKQAQIDLPTESRITSIVLRSKVATSGSELTVRVRANGTTVGSASIEEGQTSGRSVGINYIADAGAMLVVDVTTAAGEDVTCTLAYIPLTS